MNKEEVSMIGFEIVAFSGEARTKFLAAIKNIKMNGDESETNRLIEEANKVLNKAHNRQTKLLSMEAANDDVDLSFIFIHGQDHLMTTLLLKDILEHLLNIYR